MQESEYGRLLKILIDVADANKGTAAGEDDRALDAEGLALKFVFHTASALYLYRSTSLAEFGASFFDPGSVNVVCRAALETFLVFRYLFDEATTDDDRNCRYMAWVLARHLERQQFPVSSAEGKAVLEREAQLIGPLTNKLKANAVFAALPAGHQKMLLKGKWRLRSWTEIGRSAGLHDIHAKAFYAYLSGYVHAGNLSILQIRQADTAASQRSLCAGSMTFVSIAMANMVRAYCTLFPRSMERLNQQADSVGLVEFWIGVGRSAPGDNLNE